MMRRKYLELEKVKEIQDLQTKVIARCISELYEGKITVDIYLKRMRAVEKTEMFFATVFDTFEEFEEYMRKFYPTVAEGQIEHERLHYNHAMEHGLKDTKPGVYEYFSPMPNKPDMAEIFVNGVTLPYVGDNFSGWTAEEILEFEKENRSLVCSDEWESESDELITELFRRMEKSKARTRTRN